ncbi:alpha/beta fold hydrolase [Devosia sp. SL43]|uniref:alpha/beta fold hydrolase n=1 Tax=Devosia sp. SL43 TaxID=2806348 RepID=UPI001F1EA3E3|nr:alpha/beta hydrolase [Devosia sp. SL43]UJW84246.1 alpha/beta hydrolase [Devosia sp. SL43]
MNTIDSILYTTNGQISVRQSRGTGMPLLMLHGSGASKDVFDNQFAHPMADRHRMIALDLPGHGASANADDPQAAYTLQAMAATVGEVIDQLGLTHVAVFGWSLGGHVAIDMLEHNKAVAGLMLTGTPPVSRGPLAMLRAFHTSWDMLLTSKEQFNLRDIERFGRLCYGDHPQPEQLQSIARADGRVRTAIFRGLSRGDWSDQKLAVEHASVPVAIVNGAHEPIARLSYVNSLAYNTLWHGQCHVIPEVGHAPFLDAPDTFNQLLDQFVDDVGRQSALDNRQTRTA